MKLLCFQAKRFRWRTHAKTLAEIPDQEIEQELSEAVVAFVHAEDSDTAADRSGAIVRHAVKHLKWLANKRSLKTLVLHSFAHLGGTGADPAAAAAILDELTCRLREAGYDVWTTPFGYFCEWDLSVYGDSFAKVWKEIH